MLNYSKKLDRKIFILGLVIFTVFLLATTTQTDFAATNPINNTTAGGISGAINSSSPGDIIELEEGTYTGNNNTNMTINKNVTIQGKTKDKVILDAQGLSRIFVINNNLNVTFINITFTNAYTTSNGGGIHNTYQDTIITTINCTFTNNTASYGGGICSNGFYVNIMDSTFKNNIATNNGGGIYLFSAANTPIYADIIGSTLINNNAFNHGGGLYIASGVNGFSYFNITNSTFKNNIATNNGAGMFIVTSTYSSSYFNITNSNFTDNNANYGGGILIINSPHGFTQGNIINSNFKNNTVSRNGGGMLIVAGINSSSYVNLIGSIFTDNNANNGGGIHITTENDGSSNINVMNSTFIDNNANNGGGIYISNVNGSTYVNIYDSNMNGNSAGNDGGAISSITGNNSYGNTTTNIYDSNISGNSAGNNGGALSSNTGENSTGNSAIIVIDSDIENNTASNNGDTASATTGDGSTGDSEIDIIGDSTIINNNPDKDDDGIYTSTGENSTGNSEINIDDGVIKKLSSNSTIIVSNTVFGKTVVIRGVAIDENGNPLANIQLTINIDGVDYNVTTNALGEWSLNYTPTSPGTITITVDLNENNKYYAFTNTTNFNVAKANTRSTIIISNATSGKSTIIRGVLIDENGNTIANAPINVVIGGKSHNLVTGADGSWSLSYTPAKAGKFIAKVYYNGNTNNLASTSSLNYTVAQGTSAPKKTDIRLLKKKSSKVFRHGKRVVMKWYTYKNYGATGSKNITTKVIIKNLKYKLWKVYNKKLSYKYGNNKIKFKLNLKSGEKFKLKLKVYKPIK